MTIAENIRRGAGTKLTREIVDEMRRRYKPNTKGPDNGHALAREFGISLLSIHKLLGGGRWK